MIPVDNFRACITTVINGRPNFKTCRVVGVNSDGQFIVIVETAKHAIQVRVVDEVDYFDNESPLESR